MFVQPHKINYFLVQNIVGIINAFKGKCIPIMTGPAIYVLFIYLRHRGIRMLGMHVVLALMHAEGCHNIRKSL